MSFKNLDRSSKLAVLKALKLRKSRFCSLLKGEQISTKVLIVGDRPGPTAPKTSSFHHTPFYSIKNCSGWLNQQLVAKGISESDLIWLNAADWEGTATSHGLLDKIQTAKIIALGANAAKWLSKANRQFIRVDHPQFHKRFKSKENYPLFNLLSE